MELDRGLECFGAKAHHYRLNPVLPESEVQALELRYKFSCPLTTGPSSRTLVTAARGRSMVSTRSATSTVRGNLQSGMLGCSVT